MGLIINYVNLWDGIYLLHSKTFFCLDLSFRCITSFVNDAFEISSFLVKLSRDFKLKENGIFTCTSLGIYNRHLQLKEFSKFKHFFTIFHFSVDFTPKNYQMTLPIFCPSITETTCLYRSIFRSEILLLISSLICFVHSPARALE